MEVIRMKKTNVTKETQMKKLNKELLNEFGFNKASIFYFYKEVKKYVVNKPYIIHTVDFNEVAEKTFEKFPEIKCGYLGLYNLLFRPVFEKENN